ncbi:MFS transporter (plasmid) [Phyllobacteriaceae bacterium JZ32]
MDMQQKAQSGGGIGKTTLFAMAAATGIAVANIYYNQPMLGLIEADFSNQPATALIPTATQFGYALGLFFLLPLGDIVHRRKLIIGQFIVLAAALAVTAMAPSAVWLVIASLVVGAGSTVAQQIIPFAATLAVPEKRGATIGTLMAGLLSGILLSRTLSGFVGQHAGWREMFWLGVPLALAAAMLMFATLPNHKAVSRMRYHNVIRSLTHFWNHKPALRTATMVQAALFGSFSAFWTILALYLQSPQFHLGADVAGLFGVIGAVGILAAPFAGRIADRRGPHFVVWLGVATTLLAWIVFGASASLIALIAGVIILDFGIQSAMVSNQHIIYALDGEARSRLNTVFMTGIFIGGSAGSAMATIAWRYGQWHGVCVLGALLAILALIIKALHHRRHATGSIAQEAK